MVNLDEIVYTLRPYIGGLAQPYLENELERLTETVGTSAAFQSQLGQDELKTVLAKVEQFLVPIIGAHHARKHMETLWALCLHSD